MIHQKEAVQHHSAISCHTKIIGHSFNIRSYRGSSSEKTLQWKVEVSV